MALQKETSDLLLGLSVFGPRNAAVKENVRKLYNRFAKYDLPVAEVRKLVDESLGSRTLTEQLEDCREG